METNNLYIWSIKNIKSNRISIHAAQVAFFIMVSFFPFLMFFITLLKHTPISEAVLLASVQKVIPASLSSLISTWLNESFEASTTILSATVISALWAGSKGFASIAYELEAIYSDGLDKHRSFFSRRFHSILDTVLFTIMIIISLVLLVFGNQIIQLINHFLPFMQHMTLLLFLLRSAFSLLLFTIYFAIFCTILYRAAMRCLGKNFRVPSCLPFSGFRSRICILFMWIPGARFHRFTAV